MYKKIPPPKKYVMDKQSKGNNKNMLEVIAQVQTYKFSMIGKLTEPLLAVHDFTLTPFSSESIHRHVKHKFYIFQKYYLE